MIMKGMTLIALGLMTVLIGLTGTGCKKKTPKQDGAFHHTPENTHHKIQELRLQLTAAVDKKNLQYVHDSMYYFKGLLEVLSAGLQGDKKERVDGILKELTNIAEEIDNSAGRGNQAATEANLKKLIEELKALEAEFKDAGKK